MLALEAELKSGRNKVQPKAIVRNFLDDEGFDVSERVRKEAANAIRRYVSYLQLQRI